MATADYDLWGITDGLLGRYHIQSYFWVFKNTAGVKQLLDSYLASFVVLEEKSEVVGRYEVGLCQHMLKNGFRIGTLLPRRKSGQLRAVGNGRSPRSTTERRDKRNSFG